MRISINIVNGEHVWLNKMYKIHLETLEVCVWLCFCLFILVLKFFFLVHRQPCISSSGSYIYIIVKEKYGKLMFFLLKLREIDVNEL